MDVVNVTAIYIELEETNSNNGQPELIGFISGIGFVLILHNRNKESLNKLKASNLWVIYTFTLIIFPILLAILTFFWLYRQIIHLIIKLSFRSKLFALLNGPDAFWTFKDNSKGIVNILLIINCDSKIKLLETLRLRFQALLVKENFQKLSCSAHKFMGYNYLIKKNIKIEDYIYEELQIEDLQIANRDLQGLWEILLCDKTAKSNYPVIARFNHCVGDGSSLLQLLLASFNNEEPCKSFQEDDWDFMEEMVKLTIYCMHFVLVILQLPIWIIEKINGNVEKNALHGKELSGEKILVWEAEEKAKYLKTVRTIKKNVGGVGFIDVVGAALSASLADFFKLTGSKIPENISCVIPAIPTSVRFNNSNVNFTSIVLTNRFSVGVLNLPISKSANKKFNMADRLQELSRRIHQLKISYEYQINYWFLNIALTVLPEQMLLPLLNYNQSSIIISSLPGPKKLHCEEFTLENLFFWVPHRGQTGVGVTFFTYDEKFHIGISVDKIYGVSKQELEIILNSFFKNLEELDEQVA